MNLETSVAATIARDYNGDYMESMTKRIKAQSAEETEYLAVELTIF